MNNISDLLSKFKSLLQTGSAAKESVARAASEVLKTEIDSSEVEIKNGIAYINSSPLIKNEIFINKKSILEILKNQDSSIKDIR